MCWFPSAANSYQRGGLKQRKPTLSWSGGQGSDIKVSAGLVLSEAQKENLSQACPRVWGTSQPQCSLPCGCITPGSAPSSQGLLPSVSVFCVLSSSCTDTGQTGLEALVQYDLILTNDTCKAPISKQGHVLRFWVDTNLGGTKFLRIYLVLCTLWDPL